MIIFFFKFQNQGHIKKAGTKIFLAEKATFVDK